MEYPSGNGKVFADRVSWAVSYLKIAALVTKPKRGVYAVSDLGREKLARPDEVRDFVKQAWAVHNAEKQKQKAEAEPNALKTTDSKDGDDQQTPLEDLIASSTQIRDTVCDEILEVILSKSPQAFERLVVDLLQRLGYGGEIEGAGEVTQYTADGGIDGVIKEDLLGLGRIHIQAKRYAIGTVIGRPAVQGFVGALAGARSSKGIMITTSHFSSEAIAYARDLGGASLVLIDGVRLARFVYDTGMGMQVEKVIELKRLDSEFWDGMEDQADG